MKKRLLFVSLFLVSILIISGCAQWAPRKDLEELEEYRTVTITTTSGEECQGYCTNGDCVVSDCGEDGGNWYVESISAFPRYTLKADPLQICNPANVEDARNMYSAFNCMDSLTLMYRGIQFGDDEVCFDTHKWMWNDGSYYSAGLGCHELVDDVENWITRLSYLQAYFNQVDCFSDSFKRDCLENNGCFTGEECDGELSECGENLDCRYNHITDSFGCISSDCLLACEDENEEYNEPLYNCLIESSTDFLENCFDNVQCYTENDQGCLDECSVVGPSILNELYEAYPEFPDMASLEDFDLSLDENLEYNPDGVVDYYDFYFKFILEEGPNDPRIGEEFLGHWNQGLV